MFFCIICWVVFPIRKKSFYEVLRDVVSNLSWKSNRQTITDGRKNTCTLFKDNQQYTTMLPMRGKVSAKPPSSTLSTIHHAAHERKGVCKTTFYYASFFEGIPQENCEAGCILSLNSYGGHVVPKELPYELPHMRDIRHCINLVSGSALPSKPAYQMYQKKRNSKDMLENMKALVPIRYRLLRFPKKMFIWGCMLIVQQSTRLLLLNISLFCHILFLRDLYVISYFWCLI